MEIYKYETNIRRNLYLSKSEIKNKKYNNDIEYKVINIHPEITYQTFLGFGGAFTGSTSYNFNKLPKDKQISFIKDYFSNDGIGYSFCRIPIGSTDFSLSSYSYSSKLDLSDFDISADKLTTNLILECKKENKYIKFLASPWSPPKNLKTNHLLILGGKLELEYRETYSNYLVKFLQEYKKLGIDISYITIQNEPNARQLWESCLFSADEERDFAVNYLYPNLIKNNLNTKIIVYDHNKDKLFSRANAILNSSKSQDAITGLAYHYYTGDHFESLKLTHELFPDKLLIHTEGCCGFSKKSNNNYMQNGEIYSHDIIGDLNNGANAYIDWNLLLDSKGGPNHKHNYCHSPIMLNKKCDNYIKYASYYYIGHFSKFIKPNAKRIAHTCYTNKIELTSFKNEDGSIVIVLFNNNDINYEYNLNIGNEIQLHDNLDRHAIVTYVIRGSRKGC